MSRRDKSTKTARARPQNPPAPVPVVTSLVELRHEAPELEAPGAPNSWIEVDQVALRDNVRALRLMVAEDTEIMCVVKGNAYGHGYDLTIPALEEAGIRRLATFSADEARHARRVADADTRIEIMGFIHPSEVAWVVRSRCIPWIISQPSFELIEAEAERQETTVDVHLEVETGMNRTGIPYAEVPALARRINDHPHLRLEGLCTHLAGAEEGRNEARIAQQLRLFNDMIETLANDDIVVHRKHVASSAAALLYPHCHMDQVRIGIATYGFWPTPEVRFRLHDRLADIGEGDVPALRRALSWKSRVMLVRDVYDGEFVGYGDSHQAEGNERIAIIPVGYGDGFSRALSNVGYVLVRGRRASIVGPVNMNMLQVHVTHIPDVEPGDEVVLIGRQGDQEVSVSSFSDYNNMVNYEFMARLADDIPRVAIRSTSGR